MIYLLTALVVILTILLFLRSWNNYKNYEAWEYEYLRQLPQPGMYRLEDALDYYDDGYSPLQAAASRCSKS